MVHILSTTLYVIYMIKTKPYIEKANNRFEICNEFFVCIGAMFIMLYCNDTYDTDAKMDIGWFYLAF